MFALPLRSWAPRDASGWLWFWRQQALSCVFPWSLLACLVLTRHLPPWIARYDAMLIICIAAQFVLYRVGWETAREIKVIASFHVIGLILELEKTHLGCWSYPEHCVLRIGPVPLFSGFLYASVASYVCQAWRRLDLRLYAWPSHWKPIALACAIYANFFTEHIIGDLRWPIIAVLVAVFWKTRISYHPPSGKRRVPLVAGLLGVGFAIWIAENVGTRCGAWRYPYQEHGWEFVDFSKLTSWFLLIMITFLIVAELKRIPKKEAVVAVDTLETSDAGLATRMLIAGPTSMAHGDPSI